METGSCRLVLEISTQPRPYVSITIVITQLLQKYHLLIFKTAKNTVSHFWTILTSKLRLKLRKHLKITWSSLGINTLKFQKTFSCFNSLVHRKFQISAKTLTLAEDIMADQIPIVKCVRLMGAYKPYFGFPRKSLSNHLKNKKIQ